MLVVGDGIIKNSRDSLYSRNFVVANFEMISPTVYVNLSLREVFRNGILFQKILNL